MNVAVPIAATLVVVVALALFVLFRKLGVRDAGSSSDPNWWRCFSVERYRPLARLFSPDDYAFLAAQPGFRPEIACRLRAARRRIFRLYLRSIRRDFDRLHATARQFLLHARQDRPDLAMVLFKQRMMFSYAMAAIHGRLVLQTLGLGTVDVRRLVGVVEAMRDLLQALQPRFSPRAV